jgi:ribosomal protein S15P/S13E
MSKQHKMMRAAKHKQQHTYMKQMDRSNKNTIRKLNRHIEKNPNDTQSKDAIDAVKKKIREYGNEA